MPPASDIEASPRAESVVSLKQAASYAKELVLASMRECLEPLGGMSAFVKPGQRVLLKPNLLGGFAPERAVTTHPAVVRAAIQLVQEAGGRAFVGDSSALGSLSTVVQACGLSSVLEETGAELLDMSEPDDYAVANHRVSPKLTLAKALREVDVIISLPKLKTHGQMTFTGALKNQYGVIPGALKSQWHFRLQKPEWLAALILDINRTIHPALAIMDAIVAMEGQGPTSGKPRLVGALLASQDLAAVDTLACHLIGLEPEQVPLLAVAREQDFGETSMERITVLGGDWRRLQVLDFKKVDQIVDLLQMLPLPHPLLKWLRRQWTLQPVIIDGRCTRCGICENGCPVQPAAIHPCATGPERFEESRCIHCYCCHEFCPSHGIELQPPWLARHLPLEKVANAASRMAGFFKSSGKSGPSQ